MRATGRRTFAVAAIWLALANAAHAELAVVDQIGQWQLLKDDDAIFGPLGFELTTASTSDFGRFQLTLRCYFDKTDTITTGIELSAQDVDFGQFGGSVVTSLLRYDADEIREAEWLRSRDPSRVGFNAGGSNFSNDYDNPQFRQAQQRARSGDSYGLGRLLDDGYTLAGGIEMFFWNMTVKRQLALGFESRDGRTSISFDLSGGAEAVDRLLEECYQTAEGMRPEDTRSPREAAPWGAFDVRNGMYKSVSLKAGQCLELHAVRHRRGDPLTIDDLVGPGRYKRLRAETGDIVIEGPKERLEIFFGENASEGRFNHRSWTRKAATCDQD